MNKGTVTVAAAVATILGSALRIDLAQAQEAQEPNGAQDQTSTANSLEPLEEVTITGLRRSLQEAMEIKRDAIGVVDAISAEDIGKFADANLSEALQRITGISIDRRNGEGALVTARGFGAQYNMVTLNGRQMPAADAYGGDTFNNGGFAGNSRSFNFANLASEAISGIEVYKTSRADIATGGIGASINIKTARPFDNTGTIANIGFKAVNDQSNRVGHDYTPEVSGIFSFTDDDKRWGVGLTGSWQKRDSGAMGAAVNDWHIETWSADPEVNKATSQIVPTAAITDAPAAGSLYAIPDDMRYSFSDRQRERVNGQLTFQFAPIEAVTLTADYTYAINKLEEDRGEQAIWMSRKGFTNIDFDVGEAVATPELLFEGLTGNAKDFAFEQQHRQQKNELKSAGFNAAWDYSERLGFAFDFHDSTAKSLPNDPLTGGGETLFSVAGKVPSSCNADNTACTNVWTQAFMFNNSLPIAARTLYPDTASAAAGVNGNSNYAFDASSIGTQMLRINYQDQVTDIRQARLDGALKFDNGRIQFGVETRTMDMAQRGSQGIAPMGDWGVGDAGNVSSIMSLLQPFSLTGAFKDFSAPGAPTSGWRGNADQLALWALANKTINWNEAAPDGTLSYNPAFQQNNKIGEDTDALYVQFQMQGELGTFPANVVLGARYERTDVASTSNFPLPTAIVWQDNNDFKIDRASETTPFTQTNKYNNLLPSLDFDLKLTNNIKTRFSWSKSLARADYEQLTAGVDVGGPGGSTGNNFRPPATGNNPTLAPLESDNMDLALEYYFSNRGYVSLTFWDKRVNNFIGNAVSDESLFDLRDATAGPRAQAALEFLAANNQPINDDTLFTAIAMAENPGSFEYQGVTYTGGLENFNGTDAQHVAFATQYDITPNAQDPLYNFAVSRPVNNKKARIYGWEMGGQYFFGDTGFGVLANYTLVKGDVGYDNASDPTQNQFALLGLSDSANAVLMYEKFGFTVRLAYNWRDEFLSQINVGTWRSPVYVEEYDQVDLSVGYDFNDNLALSFEGLNLTGNDVRWHGRSDKQLWFLEDQSARYAVGVRYRF